MPYVPRDELVGCEVSLIGPGRTGGGVELADGTRGTVIALRGKHGSHRSAVVVRTADGVEFAVKRRRLNVTKLAPSTITEESHVDEVQTDQRYSKAPCAKCGAYRVTVSLEDESDGCGTYYDIECEACGDSYRTDGPDA